MSRPKTTTLAEDDLDLDRLPPLRSDRRDVGGHEAARDDLCHQLEVANVTIGNLATDCADLDARQSTLASERDHVQRENEDLCRENHELRLKSSSLTEMVSVLLEVVHKTTIQRDDARRALRARASRERDRKW